MALTVTLAVALDGGAGTKRVANSGAASGSPGGKEQGTLKKWTSTVSAAAAPGGPKLPPYFAERAAITGLTEPMTVQFSKDGRVFVAEKSGIIKVFAGLGDRSPQIFADLRPQVFNWVDRGLSGLALHPRFPDDPRVYVYYSYNGEIGGPPGKYPTTDGSGDDCPTPTSGCKGASRVSIITATTPGAYRERVLVEDWCLQFGAHYGGALTFGNDGMLYASGGDAAGYAFEDWGQKGNVCGDPPSPAGTNLAPPNAEGGSLRSQDLRTPGDPTGLDGTIIRIHPTTGLAAAGNPTAGDVNAQRAVAFGLRNPWRMAFRPGTNELYTVDVGDNDWEEINRFKVPVGGNRRLNFGWPCYEGSPRHPVFKSAGLKLCNDLYQAGPAAVSNPYFQYQHGKQVIPGSRECPAPPVSASLASLAFYNKGAYPAYYNGRLFFNDITHRCMYSAKAGAGGLTDVKVFASGLSYVVVDLKNGPGGDLFGVDLGYGTPGGGRIVRYLHTRGNVPPTAAIKADRTNGKLPLTVNFDGSGSSDPNGGPLKFAWDLDADGQFDDGNTPRISRTYRQKARLNVRLRVMDPKGARDITRIPIAPGYSAPQIKVTAPTPGTTWASRQELNVSAEVTDPEDGAVPDEKVAWQFLMHHCPGGTCHAHSLTGVRGKVGSTHTIDHEYPSWIEVLVTATDRDGLSTTQSMRLNPKTVPVTMRSNPPGVTLSAGETRPAPFTTTAIVGSTLSLVAPQPVWVGNRVWQFANWAHGGPNTQSIIVPETAVTYTANYVRKPNLALRKPARASSAQGPQFLAWKATDGNLGTRWSSQYRDPQWIQVNLQQRQLVGRIVLRWQLGYARRYNVQTSQDGIHWFTVYRTTNGVRGPVNIGFAPRMAQYIRVNGITRGSRWGYSLWELEAYNN